MLYTLEWNSETQSFHHNNGRHKPNTFGWETIAEKQDDDKISIFCILVDELDSDFTTKEIKMLWHVYDKLYSPNIHNYSLFK